MYNNPKHFLHEHLTFLESTGIEGKNSGFENFFAKKGVQYNKNWDQERTILDWNGIKKFQFFYDYEGEENVIREWLRNSELKNFEHLYTWFDYNDPIVKIKTSDLIEYWEEFTIASVEGLAFVSENGEIFLEFTQSPHYFCISNFEIKSGSAI
ncbi:hypothetical protein K6119_10625 [Paracrocinitomix mangrovi]|uniref:hypothetical protein n=1 Tax=Paracrocinitomix mangrovi TaxID=2862509 RepID=UPI001C8E70B8|nr:hypothetical protein [Paracrocinitomix mangrovi]UKN00186.1 hypothetical protein K6119_10625 [Paracrocinitomix mangrovi]